MAPAGALERLPHHPGGRRAQPERRGGPPHVGRRPLPGEPARSARGDLSAGVDGRADFAGYDLFRTEARERILPELGYDARYVGGGAFVRWRTLVGTRVALDLGARADGVHYRSLDRVAGGGWRSASDLIVSPKLGARFLVGRRLVAALRR